MNDYINYQQRRYPLSNQDDLVVQFYQSCYGKFPSNHQNQVNDHILYDVISDTVVRIHIDVYHKAGFSLSHFKQMQENYENKTFDQTEFQRLCRILHLNIPETITHSPAYLDCYQPHYLLACKTDITPEMMAYQLNQFLAMQPQFTIVSLEGKCAAGKTTISSLLNLELNYFILPIDDFFLPDALRNSNRLQETGGNIHYEAINKVLEDFLNNNISYYQAYNCMLHCFEEKAFPKTNRLLLEGVYSYHPYFRKHISKLVYLDIDETLQLERIKKRTQANRFIREWIPLENNYFEQEQIRSFAHLIL